MLYESILSDIAEARVLLMKAHLKLKGRPSLRPGACVAIAKEIRSTEKDLSGISKRIYNHLIMHDN